MKIIKRLLNLDLPPGKSAFLRGPRKVGKSYWIARHMKGVEVIDLLKTDVWAEYIARPARQSSSAWKANTVSWATA